MAVCTNELKEIPPLSGSAREILKIIQDDDIDLSVFARVIEQDPALLARIIGLANSAYFGSRGVNDVHRAIIDVLGFRTAKNIALGVVLGGIFSPGQCRAFDLPKFWFVSIVTATLARDCVSRLKLSSLNANDAYLSGMLNEIGLMALAYFHPDEMSQILTQAEKSSEESIVEREMSVFGNNHYKISVQLLKYWHLPDIVTQIMQESDSNLNINSGMSENNGNYREPGDLYRIIEFSGFIANLIYEGAAIEPDTLNLPDVIVGQPVILFSLINDAREQVESYREMANLLS